jgi:hypothetical protein
MVSVENKRSRRSGYPGKSSDSKIPVEDKHSTVNNYYVGASRHDDYNAINEEREARIKKEKEQAEKLKVERKLLKQKANEEKQNEANTDFEHHKKSRWDRHNTKKNNFSKRSTTDIIEEGGNSIAENIIWNEATNAAQPLKNGIGYAKNKILDVVQNPKNHKVVKDTIHGAGKAIQDTTKNLNQDLLAYGQAKALINGTGEYTEKVTKDKNGNVTGVERVFKQHGKDNVKDKTTFGLQTPIKARKSKPGPIVRKAVLVAKKGTLVKHIRSGVSLIKQDKPGITNHRRSGVKLVKSSLPVLETYDESKPNVFGESSFEGFAKKPFEGFVQKSQFHPINKHRQRAGFESTVTPQHNMLGRI